MKHKEDSILSSITAMYELEIFGRQIAHELFSLSDSVETDEDITPYLVKAKINIPKELQGKGILWSEDKCEHNISKDMKTLSFVGPGNPKALGIRVGCMRPVGEGWRVCVDCSWFSCRVVVVFDPIVVVTPRP